MGNWISINEKLKPRVGQKVLVVQDPKTTATKEALFAIYDGKGFMPPTPTYFADMEIGKSNWADIIYWMPLPATPTK